MRTPLISTIFLAAIVVLAGCKKDDDPAPPAGGGGGGSTTGTLMETTELSVQMTVDGNTVSYVAGTTYGWFGYSSMNTQPTTSRAYGFGLYEHPDPNNTVFAVDFGGFGYTGSAPSNDQFLGFFPNGAVTYGHVEEALDRVALTWWDPSGGEWSTYWGTDQWGSSFNIVETLPLTDSGVTGILVRATFSCRLYLDDGSGQFKQITNGMGVFRFDNG